MNITEKHLELITEESFKQWKSKDSFSVFASASNSLGLVQIGVNGCGLNIVKFNSTVQFKTKSEKEAIEFYAKQLLP